LPRQLQIQGEAQEGAYGNDDSQYPDTRERWGDGHRSDDVRSDEKLEAEQDSFAYLLAKNAVRHRPLGRLALREGVDADCDAKARDHDQDARAVDDLGDHIDRILEVGVAHVAGTLNENQVGLVAPPFIAYSSSTQL
jgi:hypothetical protein